MRSSIHALYSVCVLVFLAVVISACGGTSVPTNISSLPVPSRADSPAQIIPDSAVDQHIASTINPKARAVMKAIMLSLPVSRREHVIYIDPSSQVYFNDPSVPHSMDVYRPSTAGTLRDDAGREISAIPIEPKPSENSKPSRMFASPPGTSTSGAMRRMYVQGAVSSLTTIYGRTGPWYPSGIVSNVYLPCKKDNSVYLPSNPGGTSNGDTGFIYMGGWGDSTTSNGVDAGLQYSDFNDWYSPFYKTFGPEVTGIGPHYKCGQTLMMNFFTEPMPGADSYKPGVADSHLVLFMQGVTTTGTNYTVTVVFDHSPGDRWTWGGSGIVLKRMVTIGQTSDNFNDGYYFGYLPLTKTPKIRWSNTKVWFAATGGWYDASVENVNYRNLLHFQSCPDDMTKIVHTAQAIDETDGITL